MPYICLARNDIPNGDVQILDLIPNSSQPQPRTAQGQTKYVNRTIRGDAVLANGSAAFSPSAAGYLSNSTNTVTTLEEISGLTAYLLDAVQPCSNAASTARIQIALDPAAGNTIVFTTDLGSYTLTAVNPGPAGPDQFVSGAGASTTAGNIVAAINDVINQGACDTAIGFHFTAVQQGVNVDITASLAGQAGTTALTTNAAANIKFLFGGETVNATYTTTRTRRTAEAWNVNTINRVTAAIQAAVDSGAALTVTTIPVMLSPTISTTNVTAANPAVFTTASAHGLTTGDSVYITGAGGGVKKNDINAKNWIVTVASATTFSINFDNSGGTAATAAAATVAFAPDTNLSGGQLLTAANLLRILSGGGYSLPSGTVLYAPDALGGSGINGQKFHTALAGSTIEDVTASRPLGGGYWNTSAPRTPVYLPIDPTRTTNGGAGFNMSISQGTLQKLAAGPTWNFHAISFQNGNGGASGRALTAAGTPIRSYAYQGNRSNLKNGFTVANPGENALSAVSGIRILTVYDDAGNVLV